MELAGEGALLALLERRRKALAAEGLFAPERKRKLPFLPRVIGVVSSPTGAVIRDILHRLEDRCPTHVILWPVAVQGEGAAAKIAAAIRAFPSISPRPDLLIVARGGGSIEDLWAFNEEEVVRAAAESPIPLISAVGHETDTTLIDFAADLRAPTPTAALNSRCRFAPISSPRSASSAIAPSNVSPAAPSGAANDTISRSAAGPMARHCSHRSGSGSTNLATGSRDRSPRGRAMPAPT